MAIWAPPAPPRLFMSQSSGSSGGAKDNRGMSNAVRLANPRERDRILGALQRFRLVAKYPRPAGDRRDRFRLMLEAGAIDQPNRIMGADQHFDGAGDLVEREPL